MAKKAKRQSKKKHTLRNVVIILIAICVVGVAMSGESDEEEGETEVSTTAITETESETEESHIYDDAEIVDMINGTGTDKIGEVSVIRAESDSITNEVLEDWYFNYVVDAEYNYYIIAYTDEEGMGCYAITGLVEKDVVLIEDEYGGYSYKDGDNAIYYLPMDSELTEIIETESESESEKETDTEAEKTVYITESGSKYHRKSCQYVSDTSTEIALSDAVARGYTACSVCNP